MPVGSKETMSSETEHMALPAGSSPQQALHYRCPDPSLVKGKLGHIAEVIREMKAVSLCGVATFPPGPSQLSCFPGEVPEALCQLVSLKLSQMPWDL